MRVRIITGHAEDMQVSGVEQCGGAVASRIKMH